MIADKIYMFNLGDLPSLAALRFLKWDILPDAPTYSGKEDSITFFVPKFMGQLTKRAEMAKSQIKTYGTENNDYQLETVDVEVSDLDHFSSYPPLNSRDGYYSTLPFYMLDLFHQVLNRAIEDEASCLILPSYIEAPYQCIGTLPTTATTT